MRAARGSRRLVAATSLVLGLALACGSGTNHTTAATTGVSTAPFTTDASTTTTLAHPAGYSTFSDATDHFSIAVPTAWRQVDPTSPGAAKTLQDIVAANPALKSALGNGPTDLAAAGTKFLAIDVSANNGFAANVNVIAKEALGATDSDLPSAVDGLRTEYQKIGGTITSTATVALAGHQALQVKVQFPLSKPSGGKITVVETQDLVAANDFVYIVTFAGTSPAFAVIESTFSVK